jgi:hypothetical protein
MQALLGGVSHVTLLHVPASPVLSPLPVRSSPNKCEQPAVSNPMQMKSARMFLHRRTGLARKSHAREGDREKIGRAVDTIAS